MRRAVTTFQGSITKRTEDNTAFVSVDPMKDRRLVMAHNENQPVLLFSVKATNRAGGGSRSEEVEIKQ